MTDADRPTEALTIAPFSIPFSIMLKPVGARCNLACDYCYYLATPHTAPRMSDQLLERFIQEYFKMQTGVEVPFTWHGGEPLLLPVTFYENAVRLQRKYANGRPFVNVIQTNGTLLTDEWCSFLKRNNFLVGISIDGTEALHDHYRCATDGTPSWHRVMRGIGLLSRYGIEWNAMATVNAFNVHHPAEFYQFFKSIGAHYIQLSPIVERLPDGTMTPESITAREWGDFLCTIFDEWVEHDRGEYYVETFDCILANWVGQAPGICVYAKECGNIGIMESNGDIYCCDHFPFPEYKVGNVLQTPLVSLLYGARQREFARKKSQLLPRECRECEYLFACHGECPKNRILTDRYGEPGLNWLCQGYRQFFAHATPYMEWMKRQL